MGSSSSSGVDCGGATITFGTPAALREGDSYAVMVGVTLGRPPTQPVAISAYGPVTRVNVQYTTIPSGGSVATVYGQVTQDQVLQPRVQDVVVGLLVESVDPCYLSYDTTITVPVEDDERRIWFTGATFNTAGIDTKAEGDAACVVDSPNQNFPAKAFLNYADRAAGLVDWVMKPNANYFAMNNGAALVLTTDSTGRFDRLNVPFGNGNACLWTGLNATQDPGDNCANWAANDNGMIASAGYLGTIDSMAWASATGCGNFCHVLCVEQ